jgi:hypothetical protein
VQNLVTKSPSLKRFTLEFGANVAGPSSESLHAVVGLVDACMQHEGMTFAAEGDVLPWDRGACCLAPWQSSLQPQVATKRTRLLRVMKSLIPRRNGPLPVISGPSQLNLHSDVLFNGPLSMLRLCIMQPSLTHVSIRTISFHAAVWSPLLDSCHLPLLQVLSLAAPGLSISTSFGFLVRHPSLIALSFDTCRTRNPQLQDSSGQPSRFLPNLTKLAASPECIAALLVHPRSLPKLHTLAIKQADSIWSHGYHEVLRLLRTARHRSVAPISQLSIILPTVARDIGWEELPQSPSSRRDRGQPPSPYRALKSVTVLYTHSSQRMCSFPSGTAARWKSIISWTEWLRHCPDLEVFRIDGMVRDVWITHGSEGECVAVPVEAPHATSQLTSVAGHARASLVANGLRGVWKACPQLQEFSLEGETYTRPVP